MPSAFLFYEYLVFTASLITHTSPGCSPTPRYSISPCVWSLITSYPQLLSKYYDLIYHITITSCFPGLAVHACSPYNSQFQTLTVITTDIGYNIRTNEAKLKFLSTQLSKLLEDTEQFTKWWVYGINPNKPGRKSGSSINTTIRLYWNNLSRTVQCMNEININGSPQIISSFDISRCQL